MIYFYDIFERAFNLFDDPDISRKYYEDQAGFQSDMRDFLLIGKDKFTNPTAITDKLLVCEEAVGYSESDSGNGSDTYVLEQPVPNGGSKVGFTYLINGKCVHAQYNATDNSVTFGQVISSSDTWEVRWFYAGAFSADFSDCLRSDFPIDAIMGKVETILAYALCSAWGDKEVGRVIEVRNILTDTDFKMYSPANSARAKVEWRNQMNRDMDTLVSELNWRIMSTPKGGSRFGK